MKRLLAALALCALAAGCKRSEDDTPAVRERAREATAAEEDWLGGAPGDAGIDAALGGVTLPVPGRPWTARCAEVVEKLADLTVRSLAADGATQVELEQLRRRQAADRDFQIARCASRATEAEVACVLAAKKSEDLATCSR